MTISWPVLAIVGPTAVGKTDVAIEIASQHSGEIISADSMAVYRGVDIGTAKPSPKQRRGIAFHLIDVVEPTMGFSAADFQNLGRHAITECLSRGRLPIVVGGTGFYVKALLDGIGLAGVPANGAVRSELQEELERLGTAAMHERLAGVDPASAARIHPNDAVRIIRALEVWRVTGSPMSEISARDCARRRPIPSIRVGLRMEMSQLDERINERVHAMFATGLVEEVQRLIDSGVPEDAPSLRGLGYREVVGYLRGMMTLDQCIRTVQRNTRHYARRQMTWFRGDAAVQWIHVSQMSPLSVGAAVMAIYDDATRRTTLP